MSDVEVIQVVRTTLTLRGDGKTTVMRRITQYWSMAGELLAEVDPCAGNDQIPSASAVVEITNGRVFNVLEVAQTEGPGNPSWRNTK